ncbi:MAG: hypothetical protein NC337_14815 [Roseburia sp.]|nr:hypothetical protein [Roseburia sp.]
MALTPLRILELNKKVDKILHAPSNAPVKGQPLEIAFVLDLSADRAWLDETLREMVRALKAHDRIFQNVRSNVVYCGGGQISTKVTPMSFVQMGRAMEETDAAQAASASDSGLHWGALCAYLKLYHARSKCVLVLTLESEIAEGVDIQKVTEGLNPFLKYRMLIITPDKIVSGTELLLRLMANKEG